MPSSNANPSSSSMPVLRGQDNKAILPAEEPAFEVDDEDSAVEMNSLKDVELNLEVLNQKYPPPQKYEVLEEIGHGAFGTVHRAIAPDSKSVSLSGSSV